MREFFRGWKRKVGVVTLVAACVFVFGWIRSQEASDLVKISNGSRSFILASSEGTFRVMFPRELSVTLKVVEKVQGRDVWDVWDLGRPSSENRAIRFRSTKGRFVGALFGPGKGGMFSALPRWYFVPYWSFVIPLTLLSAWLLLSKQPPVKAKVQP